MLSDLHHTSTKRCRIFLRILHVINQKLSKMALHPSRCKVLKSSCCDSSTKTLAIHSRATTWYHPRGQHIVRRAKRFGKQSWNENEDEARVPRLEGSQSRNVPRGRSRLPSSAAVSVPPSTSAGQGGAGMRWNFSDMARCQTLGRDGVTSPRIASVSSGDRNAACMSVYRARESDCKNIDPLPPCAQRSSRYANWIGPAMRT